MAGPRVPDCVSLLLQRPRPKAQLLHLFGIVLYQEIYSTAAALLPSGETIGGSPRHASVIRYIPGRTFSLVSPVVGCCEEGQGNCERDFAED